MNDRSILHVALVALSLAASACSGHSTGNDNQNGNGNQVTGVCGDGVLDLGETCDDGPDNSDQSPDACRTDCRPAYCGDGVLDAGEPCDEGAGNSDLVAGACRRDCVLAHCGDGVVDPADDCDDGGTDAGDGCSPDCRVEPRWQCSGTPRSTCSCAPNRSGPDCGACRVHVDGRADPAIADGESWGTAYPTIQAGMEAARRAGPPCEVWVAEGQYVIFQESSDDALRLASGIALYGGFAGTEAERGERDAARRSVLDGSLGSLGVSAFHVVSALSVEDAVLDGFVITRGVAMGGGVDSVGAGLLAINSRVEVASCTFTLNFAETTGGGVAAFTSDLVLRDVVFTVNVVGFPGTWSEVGGGLAAFYSSLQIERALFAGNSVVDGLGGHAVYLSASHGQSHSTIIAGNGNADGFAGDGENVGGAVRLDGGSSFASRHSTTAYNRAWRGGGVAIDGTSSLDATSTIVEGNADAFITTDTDDVLVRPGAVTTASHCRVPPGFPCTGCFSTGSGFERPPSAPLALGSITALAYDPQTALLTVSLDGGGLVPDQLAGDYAAIPSVLPIWIPIVGNTASAILVWGDLSFASAYGAVAEGVPVESYSLRLAPGSPCVDAADGRNVPATDFEGLPRWDDPAESDVYDCSGAPGCIGYADVGAHERQP